MVVFSNRSRLIGLKPVNFNSFWLDSLGKFVTFLVNFAFIWLLCRQNCFTKLEFDIHL